ncbi:MAG TPA: disulfide oxidoreductase [Ruminococcaceae bacterium]|nr:disulfide oxidoreductase [Oscillospiraceae bacterium]
MTVTKDMTIGDVLRGNPALAEHFLAMGMHCLGCPSAQGETVEQACEVHGVDCAALISKLNNA